MNVQLQPQRTLHATLTILGSVSVALLAALGCVSEFGSEGERETHVTPESDGGWETRVIRDHPDICLDCVTLSPRVALGEGDGPGYLEATQFAVMDQGGRYWVLQPDGIKLFDTDGAFLRQIGREGKGPGEFMRTFGMYLDDNGYVHVFDPEISRRTTFRQDFSIHAVQRLPASVWGAAPLPGGERFVVNMNSPTPQRIGLPLHVLGTDGASGDARILASFGRPSGDTRVFSFRRITADREGTIFTTPLDHYLVEVWSSEGQKLLEMERPGLWEAPPDRDAASRSSPERQIRAQMTAIHADAAGRLWINAWVLREDWLDHTYEVMTPGGVVRRTFDDPSDVYRSVIEVIDVDQQAVVARADLGAVTTTRFMSDSVIFGVSLPEGVPSLMVFDIHTTGILKRR